MLKPWEDEKDKFKLFCSIFNEKYGRIKDLNSLSKEELLSNESLKLNSPLRIKSGTPNPYFFNLEINGDLFVFMERCLTLLKSYDEPTPGNLVMGKEYEAIRFVLACLRLSPSLSIRF